MNNSKYIVSSTPHMRSGATIEKIMLDVLIALTPAALAGIYFFGLRALLVILLSMASCVVFEWCYQKYTGQVITVADYSAAVTGLLLALNLPVSSPAWMPVVGSFFAIIIVKQIFGGLGQNFMNPALAARAFLLASYPAAMTKWTKPVASPFDFGVDAVTTATPLGLLKEGGDLPPVMDLLIGNIGGTIGETCAIALLLGGVYLLYKKVIRWQVPVTYLATVFVLTFIIGSLGGSPSWMPLYHILAGGLLLGAFFMATDYSSSPVTPRGQLIMGFGCGLITVLIRAYGSYPEGVSYSILIMNLFVPIIDRFTKPRVFGHKGAARK